jgi:protease I
MEALMAEQDFEQDLSGLRVAILATDLFEEAELVEPMKALDEAGAVTVVIAPHAGEIQAVRHDVKTRKVKVNQTLEQADPDDFDAVLLPGGAMNSDALRMDEDAQDFVREMDDSGKPIAVICHGGWLLVSAGLVDGRHMTSYYTIQDDIHNAGGEWTDEECVRDDNWVSSRSPHDIPIFNKEMIHLFAESTTEGRKAA